MDQGWEGCLRVCCPRVPLSSTPLSKLVQTFRDRHPRVLLCAVQVLIVVRVEGTLARRAKFPPNSRQFFPPFPQGGALSVVMFGEWDRWPEHWFGCRARGHP